MIISWILPLFDADNGRNERHLRHQLSFCVTGLIIELFLNLLWVKTAFKYWLALFIEMYVPLTLFMEMYVQLLDHYQERKIRKIILNMKNLEVYHRIQII